MKTNDLLKIICSLPVIILLLYFLPFLGICLLIVRLFIYRNKKIPFILISCGILLLIPKLLLYIINTFKLNISINKYIYLINENNTYLSLFKYSKLLIIVGFIYLVVSLIVNKILNSALNKVHSYIMDKQSKEYEISKENDLLIKEKQERAKNTRAVKCPHCGHTNIISEASGVCKFCRQNIQ